MWSMPPIRLIKGATLAYCFDVMINWYFPTSTCFVRSSLPKLVSGSIVSSFKRWELIIIYVPSVSFPPLGLVTGIPSFNIQSKNAFSCSFPNGNPSYLLLIEPGGVFISSIINSSYCFKNGVVGPISLI